MKMLVYQSNSRENIP